MNGSEATRPDEVEDPLEREYLKWRRRAIALAKEIIDLQAENARLQREANDSAYQTYAPNVQFDTSGFGYV
jgi:hypothetical protein